MVKMCSSLRNALFLFLSNPSQIKDGKKTVKRRNKNQTKKSQTTQSVVCDYNLRSLKDLNLGPPD